MEREIRAAVYSTMIRIWNCMLDNAYVKNSSKANGVINVKQVIIILITIIHKDVKVIRVFS